MWNQGENCICVAGHRGFPDKYPENTLPSFCAAIDAGVDMIEMDIRMTRDGELVVIHDATVDRTCDGSGPVAEMSLKEIRALDAGKHMGDQHRGVKIPTFEEVLGSFEDNKDILYNFEFKEYPRNGNTARAYEAADSAMELIAKYKLAERCVINAFDATILQYVHDRWDAGIRLHGYYPVSFLNVTEENTDPYTYLYCACPFESQRSPSSYEWLWKHGIQPWAGAWVKTEADVHEAISYKAPLITCNNPEAIVRVLRTLNLHP